jgi:hypothetical protein
MLLCVLVLSTAVHFLILPKYKIRQYVTCKIWGFHGEVNLDCGLLAVAKYSLLVVFQHFKETQCVWNVGIQPETMWHNPEDYNLSM